MDAYKTIQEVPRIAQLDNSTSDAKGAAQVRNNEQDRSSQEAQLDSQTHQTFNTQSQRTRMNVKSILSQLNNETKQKQPEGTLQPTQVQSEANGPAQQLPVNQIPKKPATQQTDKESLFRNNKNLDVDQQPVWS